MITTFLSKKYSSILSLLTILIACLVLIGCTRFPASDTQFLMGTSITISIYDTDERLPRRLAYAAIDSAFEEVERIEEIAKWTELNRLNVFAGIDSVPISQELIDLIDLGYDLADRTENAFRPDLGGLTELWGINTDSVRIPDPWEIDSVLATIDATEFIVYDSCFAMLRPHYAVIDLGGLAKGYAVDRTCRILQDLGVSAGIVEAGGDLRCFGSKPDGTPWNIAVRHPRNLSQIYTTVSIDSGSIATSGDYERYAVFNGVKYHHIFDPATGYPGRRSVSTTVITNSCALADAFATALFVMGPEIGVLYADTNHLDALIIYEHDGEIVDRRTNSFQQKVDAYVTTF